MLSKRLKIITRALENDKQNFTSWPTEVDIPNQFHSIDEEGPFESCCVCNTKVQKSGRQYLIERSFQRVSNDVENVLFEYAICMDCAQEMNQSMSEHSMQTLATYFASYFQGEGMFRRIHRISEDPNSWYNECMVKKTPRGEMAEYNICGLFQGKKMLLGQFPYIIGMEAMDEITELLSAETKDELDNFRDTFLGGPPEFQELLKGRPVLVI